MDNQSKLIKQLSNLYIIQRGHYLIQYKEPYGYRQYTAGQIVNNKKARPLMDWQFEKHLSFDFTVGTFGGKFMTKFISFDVDFRSKEMATWITYKISDTLKEIGIEHHYISFSGNKGYHIDIFFEDLVQIKHAEMFYNYVLNESGIRQYFNQGDVEFRPTSSMGIKLPLGQHQVTGNYCGFCLVEDGLKVMNKELSEKYIFYIVKIDSDIILDILGIDENEFYDKPVFVKTEDAISTHRPLANYEQSEDYSIDLAQDLLSNGLKIKGSRHKSLLLLCMYFKYMGLEIEQWKSESYIWMEWQNPELYTTPLKDCFKDIDQIVKDVFEKNYNLTANKKVMTVSLNEIKWIIEKCPEKNQKLIAYAMLIHSKRHANMQGVFYMPFKDIETATGLYDQAVQNQVNKLIKLNVLEVIERNRRESYSRSKPNLYRMSVIESDEHSVEHDSYVTDKNNDFVSCMKFHWTDKELRKMLTRKQYKSLVG